MAKDPVCGMQVDEKAAATSVYQGTTYYFCAPGCKVTFDKNPEKFVGKGGAHAGHRSDGGGTTTPLGEGLEVA